MLDTAEQSAVPPSTMQRQAVYSDDDMIRKPEIRRRCDNIGNTTFWRWRTKENFPEPDAVIAGTEFWYWGTVKEWLATKRRPKAGG